MTAQLRAPSQNERLLTILSDGQWPSLPEPQTPEEARFFAKVAVDRATGCWDWVAAKSPTGYAHFSVNGRVQYAHRVVFKWFWGPLVLGDLEVDHLCRNRACVNPLHLEAVTHAENVRRGALGEAMRTHCKHGHEYTPENTRRLAYGEGRKCRACDRQRHRAASCEASVSAATGVSLDGSGLADGCLPDPGPSSCVQLRLVA